MTTKELEKRIIAIEKKFDDVEDQIKALSDRMDSVKVRDRGPASTRTMTKEDAERVILGDLKDKSHKVAASELGLSYGQIYSARGGYTFREVAEKSALKK